VSAIPPDPPSHGRDGSGGDGSAGVPGSAGDELVRTLSADGSVAVRALVATGLVAEARHCHDLTPTAANALGRALMGGLLLASGAEPGETVQLQFRGDGPLGSMIVIADPEGGVRGTVGRGSTELPAREGRADVAGAVGQGVLAVVRSHPRRREPYTGITPLQTGEVASDLARYLDHSEQTPSAVGLGVSLAPGGAVEAAAGFFVQALPDADPQVVERVERNVARLGGPAERVRAGAAGMDLLDALLEGVGRRDVHAGVPRYHCPCDRERVTRTLVLLGADELEGIAERGETVEVRCEFCGTLYAVGPQEAGALARLH